MNKSMYTVYGLIALGCVVLGLLVGYLMFASPQTTSVTTLETVATTSPATTTATTSATAAPTKPKAVTTPAASQGTPSVEARKALLAAGNTQCTYEQISGNNRSTNTLFLSGGKARGEFRTSISGDNRGTIMVYDGSYIYTWTEGMATGQKTTLRAVSDVAKLIPNDTSLAMILGKSTDGVGWNCHPWIVDASKLSAPSYIAF
jgi:hypothetical protein